MDPISLRTSSGICPTHLVSASVLTGLFTWSVDSSLLKIEGKDFVESLLGKVLNLIATCFYCEYCVGKCAPLGNVS